MKVSRSSRLNGEYQKEISEIIRTRLKDKEPELKGIISVTEADVAPDLKTAKIYISIYAKDDAEKAKSFDILSENAGFIRHELSQVMRMRTVPALTFLWDGSMAYGRENGRTFQKNPRFRRRGGGKVNATLEEIAARIKGAKSVAVLTHMRPDGDAFGSALALSSALETLGIPHCVCDESEIPSNLAFLEGIGRVQKDPAGRLRTVYRGGFERRTAFRRPCGQIPSRGEETRYESTSITTSPTPVSQSTISCGNVPRIV